ncbi:MAG: ribbon-helix-helix domain-containing protein [Acetobacteraceae bacterium]
MAQRPSFGALKKTKPAPEIVAPAEDRQPAAKAKPAPRIQTSVRLEPELWAALNDLAVRQRVETGQRVTVHDLMIDGAKHVLAVHGIKVAE